MGKCQAEWVSIPPILRTRISLRLLHVAPLGPQALSNSVYGLGRMGVRWADLSPPAKEALELSFPSAIKSNEQVVANLLWGLGCMEVDVRNLKSTSIQTLQQSFVDSASAFTSQGLANALHGMGRMNMDINDMDDACVRAIERACVRGHACSIDQMRCRAMSSVVWSLGQLGCLWRGASGQAVASLDVEPTDDTTGLFVREDFNPEGASSSLDDVLQPRKSVCMILWRVVCVGYLL